MPETIAAAPAPIFDQSIGLPARREHVLRLAHDLRERGGDVVYIEQALSRIGVSWAEFRVHALRFLRHDLAAARTRVEDLESILEPVSTIEAVSAMNAVLRRAMPFLLAAARTLPDDAGAMAAILLGQYDELARIGSAFIDDLKRVEVQP